MFIAQTPSHDKALPSTAVHLLQNVSVYSHVHLCRSQGFPGVLILTAVHVNVHKKGVVPDVYRQLQVLHSGGVDLDKHL